MHHGIGAIVSMSASRADIAAHGRVRLPGDTDATPRACLASGAASGTAIARRPHGLALTQLQQAMTRLSQISKPRIVDAQGEPPTHVAPQLDASSAEAESSLEITK
ncbi:hypothetical protein [Xanthomonas sacchari]|uniref:hypothetical protein n=1 Tax=Xanthomonas sacchari TaxID=56458 RepID=UPI0035275909